MNMTEKRVTHDGVDICTQSFGSPNDPALVLIMGATASMLGWPDALCRSLAQGGLHVLRFDHRDTGQSTTLPPGEAGYSVEDMAADVLAILDGHGIQRAHLFGMSLGGLIAQMVALRAPDRVHTLILTGAEPLGWDGPDLPHIAPAFMDHFAGIAALDWSDQAAVAAFLTRIDDLCAGPGDDFDPVAAEARVRQVLARTASPASMFNHGAVQMQGDWTGRFRDITCPVLVIHGENDPILPLENGRALANGIARATLAVMPGMGHALPPNRLDEITARILALTRAAQESRNGQ